MTRRVRGCLVKRGSVGGKRWPRGKPPLLGILQVELGLNGESSNVVERSKLVEVHSIDNLSFQASDETDYR